MTWLPTDEALHLAECRLAPSMSEEGCAAVAGLVREVRRLRREVAAALELRAAALDSAAIFVRAQIAARLEALASLYAGPPYPPDIEEARERRVKHETLWRVVREIREG